MNWQFSNLEIFLTLISAVLMVALIVALTRRRKDQKDLSTKTSDELKLAKDRLELTQTVTGITSWEWNLVSNHFIWTAGRPNLHVLKNQAVMLYDEVIDAVHPEDREHTRAAARRAIDKNEPYTSEFRVILPDGNIRWVSSRGKVFYEASGMPQLMLGVNMDITDRKAAEAALRDSEERFRATFEQAAVGIAHARLNGRITLANRWLCSMLGYSPAELERMMVLDIIYPDERAQAIGLREQLFAGTIPSYTQERYYQRKDRSRFAAEVNVSLLRDDKGVAKYAIIIVKDITERRLVAEKMQMAMEAADAANLAKSQFLANVSHEIRTPLTAILGFAELLKEPQQSSPGRQQHLAEVIYRNGQGLKTLIDGILDLSKIEAGRLDLEITRTSLSALLEELRSLLANQAASKGLELKIEWRGNVPDVVYTDETRLKQILLNMIDNAIKFTDRGSVVISAGAKVSSTGSTAEIEFDITDTGIGISKAQEEKLFQAFSQADASTSRRYGGTGLGLALARRLARLFAGDLVLRSSTPGVGSTFIVSVSVSLIPTSFD